MLSFSALALGLGLSSCNCRYPQAPEPRACAPIRAYPRADRPLAANTTLAVIGDVQRTSWIECCALHREVNDVEQRILLADLAAQRPAGLVLLGDMAFSASAGDWRYFDGLLLPLRERADGVRTAFFPVLGNHDYSGSPWRVREEVGARFPGLLEASHYAFDWGDVRMIVLDGNRERLCAEPRRSERCRAEWQAQLDWLAGELEGNARQARRGRGALLFVHQSPYTQSPLVQGDQTDARDFARLLLASERGLALISAHAHGFERYRFVRSAADQRPPKYFIVSAGGGGPRPSERAAGAWPDESLLPWPRPFNYLLLEQDARGVRVRVRGLNQGEPQARELEQEGVVLAFQP